jgi:2-hydroxy-6-oxonona-2,4-dienedioate hydrolase
LRASFVDVDGIKTRFLHGGRGPALFLLHGVGVSASTFFRNIDVLGARCTVYAPDMLGHGFTDSIDLKGGPPQVPTVRHLGRLADQLGVERYSIGGSSYGGLIAALMWFDRPQRVDNLILIGTGAVFHPGDEQERTLRGAAANASQAMGDPTLDSCRKRLGAICYDPRSVPEEILLDQLVSYAQPDRFDAYKATIAGLIATCSSKEHRVYTRLEQITARTLILTGREDIRAKVELHLEGRRRMPNARLAILGKCGHLPYIEHPAEFNRLVDSFLAGESVGD